MQFKTEGRSINKWAIALLCLVVLELVLVGNHVESVKSLKKKILLKKFKKLLPLLALVKPKKKILLLPIPFPMFNKHGMNPPRPNVMPSPNMIVRPANQGAFMVVDSTPAQQAPMMMLDPTNTSGTSYEIMPPSSSLAVSNSAGPSMTMTISSVDPGAMSSIELNTNMMAPAGVAPAAPVSPPAAPTLMVTPSMSAPLIQQFQQQQQQPAHYSGQSQRLIRPISGVQYVAEPVVVNQHQAYPYQTNRDCDQHRSSHGRSTSGSRLPLLSPAKFFRSERYQLANKSPIRQQQLNDQQIQQAPIIIAARTKQAAPLVTINHNWRPSSPAKIISASTTQAPSLSNTQQHQIQQQQIEQHLEMEDLVSVGPPQLIPVYQTPNGRLHMTPPPQQTTPATTTSSTSSSNLNLINNGFDSESSANEDLSGEVRYINAQANSDLRQSPGSSAPSSTTHSPHDNQLKPTLVSGPVQGTRSKSQINSSAGGY